MKSKIISLIFLTSLGLGAAFADMDTMQNAMQTGMDRASSGMDRMQGRDMDRVEARRDMMRDRMSDRREARMSDRRERMADRMEDRMADGMSQGCPRQGCPAPAAPKCPTCPMKQEGMFRDRTADKMQSGDMRSREELRTRVQERVNEMKSTSSQNNSSDDDEDEDDDNN